MRDNKGFTLIELLAVIVILAIVALVTTPAILNVVNNSRVEGAKDKAWGTIEAVKLAYAQDQQLQSTTYATTGTYTVMFSGTCATGTTASTCGVSEVGSTNVTMSGDKPTEGTVTIDLATGTITAKNLKYAGNGTYYCQTTDGNTMNCQTGKFS